MPPQNLVQYTVKGSGVEDMKSTMLNMWNNRDDADLTVVCGPLTIKVHGCVVSTRSKVLEAMCKGRFREGETKRIELYGDDPDYVEMMLRYCYSTDYATNSTALNDAKMYAMGDKYDMQNLKLLAEEKFAVSITKSPDDFIASIVTVYTSTPDSDRGLRGLVAGYAVYHWKKLFSMPDFQKAIAQNLGVVNDIIEGHSLSTTAQIFSEYTRLELPKGIKRKKMRPKSDTGQTEISDLEFGSGTSDGF